MVWKKGLSYMEKLTKQQIWILVLAVILVAGALAGAFGGQLKGFPAEAKAVERGYVAVIRIDGEIYGGEDSGNLISQSQGTASERVMRELQQARNDPRAKAVLLRINSPGGSASAAQEIAEEVDKIKSAGKPVVVSMGDLCASAGYWIASRGDYLFASPASMTGSIGVYIDYNNIEELMNKLGIHNEKIKSGAHKDILSFSRPMTGEERAMLQQMVDDIYNQFLHVVADGRHMDVEKVRAIADGRIFTGQQALSAGLIDAVGNYYDALGYAGSAAGLGDGKIPTHSYSESHPLKGLFSSEWNGLSESLADRIASKLLAPAEANQPVVK